MKSYLQQFKVDFNPTFVVIVKPMVFWVFFTITAFYNLDIDQLDIKIAFSMEILINCSILNFQKSITRIKEIWCVS